MKAIITGKRYDTEKAVLIGEGGVGSISSGDFSHWKAGLYRTPISRQYFLAGEGGPMTRFRQTFSDGMRGYGKKLIPLTRKDAFEWAQGYLDDEVVEAEFSDLIEDA
jgi:TnpA family transposase